MRKFNLNWGALCVACLLFTAASLSAQPTVSFDGEGITQPNSNGAGDPYPSTIDVSGIGANFQKVTVTLTGLSHTYPDDINILLVSPSGARCVLMSDVGGGDDVNDVEYIFADGAPAMDPSNFNPSGTYRPSNSGPTDGWPGQGDVTQPDPMLSVFNDADADGEWALYYNDDSSGDSGSIDSWSISFELKFSVENDDCVNAEPIGCGETVSGTTIGALPDEVRRCGSGTPGSGVWYTFDPSDGGFVQSLSTCDAADFDTRISIFYGDCGRLRCLGSVDDSEGCPDGTTEIVFTPFFGRTHYVLVQSSNPGEAGDFDLTYNCDYSFFRGTQAGNVINDEAAPNYESIRLYPNPAQDVLNVELSSFMGQQAVLRIHNSLGQVMQQRRIGQVEEQVERLNTSNLQPGMYYLTVQAEGRETITEKFLVGAARP